MTREIGREVCATPNAAQRQRHYTEMEVEAIAKLRDAFGIFFSSPCFSGMNRDELADQLLCAISTAPPSTDVEDKRHRIAADVVELVWQDRAEDPLAVLSTDVGVHLMGFFNCREVSRMREVSKRWCDVGNAWLATVRRFIMGSGRQSLVQFVSRRLTFVQSLTICMFHRTGHSAQDVDGVLSACRSVTSLTVEQDTGGYGSFTPLIPIITTGAFRNLVSLQIGLFVSDEDANAMAGHLPSLRALCMHWSNYAELYSPPTRLLSCVAAFINGIPSLVVLRCNTMFHLTRPFPACRPGIRRLGLSVTSFTQEGLRTMLTYIGSELRSLDISCAELTDASVKCIADMCPQLERLDICLARCPLVTPACLPFIAQLANLQDVALDYPRTFTDTDMDWLMQHTRSAVLNDYRKRLAQFGGLWDVRVAFASFNAMQIAEGVAVCTDLVW